MSRLVAKNKANALSSFLKIDQAEKAVQEAKNIMAPKQKQDDTMQDLINMIKRQIQEESEANKKKTDAINLDLLDKEPLKKEKEKPEGKIILLHQRRLRKLEIRELQRHFMVVGFDKQQHLGRDIDDIIFEILTIPVNRRNGREFYQTIVKSVNNNDDVTVIFLSKTGRKIDIPEIKKKYHCEYVKKRLPKKPMDAVMFKILLFTDHLARITKSCGSVIKILLK